MFELASALFSIADANEFRFARFYIVCEEVALAPLKSPLIVCGLPDTSCGLSKRGKDTEYNVKSGMQEIHVLCSNDSPRLLPFWNRMILPLQILSILLPFHFPSVSRPPAPAGCLQGSSHPVTDLYSGRRPRKPSFSGLTDILIHAAPDTAHRVNHFIRRNLTENPRHRHIC